MLHFVNYIHSSQISHWGYIESTFSIALSNKWKSHFHVIEFNVYLLCTTNVWTIDKINEAEMKNLIWFLLIALNINTLLLFFVYNASEACAKARASCCEGSHEIILFKMNHFRILKTFAMFVVKRRFSVSISITYF